MGKGMRRGGGGKGNASRRWREGKCVEGDDGRRLGKVIQ